MSTTITLEQILHLMHQLSREEQRILFDRFIKGFSHDDEMLEDLSDILYIRMNPIDYNDLVPLHEVMQNLREEGQL